MNYQDLKISLPAVAKLKVKPIPMCPKKKTYLLAFPSEDDTSRPQAKRRHRVCNFDAFGKASAQIPQGFVQPKNAEIQYCTWNFIGIMKILCFASWIYKRECN